MAGGSGDRASLLGSYVLPGGPTDPTPIIDQARSGEALGLGHLFIGERYATKDLGVLAGALTQVTSTIGLVGGVTHIGTRHPMTLASMGQTMQAMSDGRFVLGFGRGSAGRWRSYGLPAPTSEMLRDTAWILRRLWGGERVEYDGPAGRFPALQLMEQPDQDPPSLLLAAVGPNTLDLGGQAFDHVLLHPFLTPDAVHAASERVRRAATEGGRDPDAIRIHATVIVAADRDPSEIVGARALGYLLVDGLGDALVRANEWDTDELLDLRSHERFAGLSYNEIKAVSPAELAVVAASLPAEWLSTAAATGPVERCAARLDEYLDAGATDILVHGSTPETLEPLAAAFGDRR